LSGTFDSLTSGRIPIIGADGLLTDDSDLTFSGDTLTATKISTGQLTLDLTQNYIVAARSTGLALQSQTSGTANELELFTKDFDGTDRSGINIYGVSTSATDITNRERLQIRYDPTLVFEIFTEANGTGTLRPLVLYTEGNSNQLKLNTDGSINISAGLLQLDSNNKLQWRDSEIYAYSDADGDLLFVADDVIQFQAEGGVLMYDNDGTASLTIRSNTNNAYLYLDSNDDGLGVATSYIDFADNRATKWRIVKNTDNNLYIYDDINNVNVLGFDGFAINLYNDNFIMDTTTTGSTASSPVLYLRGNYNDGSDHEIEGYIQLNHGSGSPNLSINVDNAAFVSQKVVEIYGAGNTYWYQNFRVIDSDLYLDDTTTGSDANSPALHLRGNYWNDPNNVEIEGSIDVIGSSDPRIRFQIDDNTGSAVEVFGMYSDRIVTAGGIPFYAQGGVQITGATGDELYVYDADGDSTIIIRSGTDDANLYLDSGDDGTTEASWIYFQDDRTTKWKIGKDTDNTFRIYDDINDADVVWAGLTTPEGVRVRFGDKDGAATASDFRWDPAASSGMEGFVYDYSVNNRLYFYGNGAPRYISVDGGFWMGPDHPIDILSGQEWKKDDYFLFQVDKFATDGVAHGAPVGLDSILNNYIRRDEVESMVEEKVSQKLKELGLI